jgi:hypothetical protein
MPAVCKALGIGFARQVEGHSLPEWQAMGADGQAGQAEAVVLLFLRTNTAAEPRSKLETMPVVDPRAMPAANPTGQEFTGKNPGNNAESTYATDHRQAADPSGNLRAEQLGSRGELAAIRQEPPEYPPVGRGYNQAH